MLNAPYDVEREHDVLIATPHNFEVEALDMLELVAELCAGVRSDACRTVLFDLSQVAYLSSACLGEMVSLARDIEPMRSRIVLAGCVADVKQLLEVTRLCTLFESFDTMEEAREELGLAAQAPLSGGGGQLRAA
ncbi:STAS domain-containing protein [Phycisphaera mikurensis]|uniref:STAS domain-containing protein n=1 Tax=Phycisphaera mikurensis (strain NBRC 102666 / KCTC 22515 / FYK2301M01) TaxID=1142394 RepID=I0IDS2_PHYMF|nr:STAS domain-containing protein [Phycisphaera mikurensis]MBB6441222.1 anti-anti-sigma factor [Phycisphaera mikurensis]BAM03410.1 hypothetical protein PSMK_12510 [Phycisphaera mikurensis NBRC 102666]